jgi:universal stress protein A
MTSNLPIRKILIPIDFSDGARLAFYAGLSLAAKYGAETYVLHVAEPVRAFDFSKKKYVETKDTIDRVEEGVKRRIDDLWKDGGIETVDRRKVHIVVRGGKAAQEIIASAKAKAIDLIVMGHSNDTGIDAVIGGTSERVLRNAPCSVLCVRSQDGE